MSICIVIGGGLLILVIGVTPVILLLDMSSLMWNGLWEVFDIDFWRWNTLEIIHSHLKFYLKIY